MEKGTKDKGKVLVQNFYRHTKDHAIYEKDLGWQDWAVFDSMYSESAKIFNYYVVEVGLNMAFYYADDGNFYTIETEKEPNIEVRRIFKDPNWDGKYLMHSVMYAACTYAPGEILYIIHKPEDVWNTVKIGGKSLEEVIARSVILELD